MYQFYVTGSNLPDPYYFNSDVIEYVIENSAKGLNYSFQETGFYIYDWTVATAARILDYTFDSFRNAFIWTRSQVQDYVYSETSAYSWDFECTGIDPNDPASGDYGTAYGFRFKGLCGDTIDVKLDANGNFYGHSIGNFTYGNELPDYIPHIIHQMTPENIWVPTSTLGNFSDLRAPYIDGKELHFFFYLSNVEHEIIVDDFTDTSIWYKVQEYQFGTNIYIYLISPNHYCSVKYDGSNISVSNGMAYVDISNVNLNNTGNRLYRTGFTLGSVDYNLKSFSLPGYYNPSSSFIGNYNYLGVYENSLYAGSGNIYLKSYNTTPITNPDPDPLPYGTPIPITSIPDSPDDPLPQNIPDPEPIPGITYPEPEPLPLPPFATIVSGNDDLWGQTIELQGLENSLLPYLGSLGEFNFPSFSDLLTEYTGSLIWVAQIMSLLYNGTPLNILFIVLCLFSLVSILIGAYKLWSSTEPDPKNGGRRYKKPPKGGKKH